MVHVNIYSAIININAVTPVSIIKYMSIYTALGELNNLGDLNCGFEVQTVKVGMWGVCNYQVLTKV